MKFSPTEEWSRKPNRRTKVKPDKEQFYPLISPYICSKTYNNINRILVIGKNEAIFWKMPGMAATSSNFIPFPLHKIDILLIFFFLFQWSNGIDTIFHQKIHAIGGEIKDIFSHWNKEHLLEFKRIIMFIVIDIGIRINI